MIFVKEIIVSDFSEERYIAVKENRLVDFFYEPKANGSLVGNVYLGVVKNIIPGIQAAFVDIGGGNNVFLHISDIIKREKTEKIQELFSKGDKVLVQVKKEVTGDKKPKASDQISLSGNYIILTNEAAQIGVSKKIKHNKERSRLKGVVASLIPADKGAIVRTRAKGKSKEKLAREIKLLLAQWEAITENSKANAPVLLYENNNLLEKVFKKEAGSRLTKVVVDSKASYDRLKMISQKFSPNLVDKINYHTAKKDIFSNYGLTDDIKEALAKKVSLSCGGYVVFDNTEALTVIDVNTGKHVTNGNFADVIYKTNYQAAKTIIKQLKIRNIGGIVIIDFIDMKRKKDQKKLLKILKKELARDSIKSSVLGITKLGLVEITRERKGKTLQQALQQECSCCNGKGHLLKDKIATRLNIDF